MLVKDKKAAVLMRIAAVITLVFILLMILHGAADLIVRQRFNMYLTRLFRFMTEFDMNWYMIWQAGGILSNLMTLTAAFAVMIVLFIAKGKAAGIVTVVFTLLAGLAKTVEIVIHALYVFNSMSLRVSFIEQVRFVLTMYTNYCKDILKDAIVCAVLSAAFIFLGLVLAGAFKKASKPLGFIAAGVFICACLILTSVGLAEGGLDVVQLITGRGDTAVIIMNVIEKVLPPLLAVNVYVSAVLTSIAAAIRRRESVKTADEDAVIS